MIKQISTILYIASALFLQSCIKPFEADSFNYEKTVVVDGSITDQLKTHTILLSYTYPVDDGQFSAALSGAQVWVTDDLGQRIDFLEANAGQYNSEIEFAAQGGRSYQLEFVTDSGEEYRSSMSKLYVSPPIDSIYLKYAELAVDGQSDNIAGVQVFADISGQGEKPHYFRYEWEEYYKIITPYNSQYDYIQETNEPVERADKVSICYEGGVSNSMILGTTVGSANNSISELPVNFIGNDSDRFRNRYTILLRQYSISEETYSFYRRFKESNESGGSLFDIQHGTIVGNLESVSDPEEIVLGYFEVAGVDERREFFNYNQFRDILTQPPFRYSCQEAFIINTSLDSLSYFLGNDPYFQILTIADPPRALIMARTCTDCTWYASASKPDFWID